MVVIIGAVPDTPRRGRNANRSIATPRMPVPSIVTMNAATRMPANGSP